MRPDRRFVRCFLTICLLAGVTGIVPLPAASAPRLPCDPLDKSLCLLPFPNDRFTQADPSTDTGRRIDFQLLEMPRSIIGKPILPDEWNRNDGFSPGSEVLTFVPGLDLYQTWGTVGMPGGGGPNDPRDHLADIGRYAKPDAPILLIDATTGQRWPFWSELDSNPGTGPGERLLIIRPAINFLEGHRYLVALRNMRDGQGGIIPAGAQFAAYRDGTPGPLEPTFEEGRRASVDAIIETIGTAETGRGIPFDRSELFLAWDFTIASERNLTERVLHMRDTAFAQLGDTDLDDGVVQGEAPAFAITTITDESSSPAKLRRVEGTVTVPNFLVLPPQPPAEEIPIPVDNPVGGSLPGQAIPTGRFFYGLEDLPQQNPVMPTIEVPFVCTIPKAATVTTPAHPMLYGHGLLGSRFESTGGSTERDRERNFMPCAVNWMGFAEYDVANAVVGLLDPSNMPSLIDRAQQGFLNFLMLGRALVHPAGLASDPAFQAGGVPIIETGKLSYDGNSQGGIMGGALTALGVDFTRAVLGVPGMNYSTLLNRSVDWEGELINPEDVLPAYSSLLYTMFPNSKQQQVVMALIQMLWDRGETNGYAQHVTTDPLPNTPAHQVMLHVALGDFQVTNFAAEVEARTIDARVMDTALMPGRHWSVAGYFGLPSFPRDAGGAILPWNGSALVYWDSGNLLPPNANVPPSEEGGDPHEDPRRDPRAGDQKAHFWLTGQIIDVMDGGPYLLCRPGIEDQIPRVPSLFASDWCVAP
ncbi:MAG TPA: hypothetical protein VJ922_01655 [Actinomycetota bacterium]|nr:hypothetical protein [Actinomycetota bacterium]